MPKEVIRNAAAGPFEARIGWGHGGVQMGVESVEGRSLLWLLYGDKLADLGATIRQVLADQPQTGVDDVALATGVLNMLDVLASGCSINGDEPASTVPYTYMGVWADLDREGCNELIRHLRRARDATFGRDE